MPPGLPSTWSWADCEAHIRERADAGVVEFTRHANEQSDGRNITKSDILRVLRKGELVKHKPAKPPHSGVVCLMQFMLPDGLTSVPVSLSDTAHSSDPHIAVLTTF